MEMISNRLALVPREHLHGGIQGVWWGYNACCLARSPDTVLLWSSGTPYTAGRMTNYGSSHLTALLGMSPDWGRKPKWLRIGPDGGRLSVARISEASATLAELFGADVAALLPRCVKERMTLLIEGGGETLTLKNRIARRG
jgi:hypothetical protein